ncbi:MAG: glycosyltransferase family 87 protein, partial [Terriglobales bacterium]
AKVIAAILTLAALARRWELSSPLLLWPGFLLLAPYAIQELRYGNAQLLIVLLVIWAFLFADHHPHSAGVILGLAVALKVWPLFFLPCLLTLRRWRFTLTATAATIVWTLVPVLWRGPMAQFRLLGQWLVQERAIAATAARTVGFWYPGQSLHDVLARYLTVVNYGLLPDSQYGQVAWLQLSPAALQWVWWTLSATLTFTMLLLLARRYAAPVDAAVAFLFCALLVLEPHVHRIIYVSLAWPALWLASERVHGRLTGLDANLYWLSVAVAVLEPLIPGGGRQRWLQVYGTDFWLVLLPLTVVAVLRLWHPVRAFSMAKANSG